MFFIGLFRALFALCLLSLVACTQWEGQAGATSRPSGSDSTAPPRAVQAYTFLTGTFSYGCQIFSGKLSCIGDNNLGQLGVGDTSNRSSFSEVVFPDNAKVNAVAVGPVHACAISETGQVGCWGNNSRGELGKGAVTSIVAPSPGAGISGLPPRYFGRELSTHYLHTCLRYDVLSATGAITTQGAVACWGSNFNATVGIGSATPNVPQAFTVIPSGATAIGAGDAQSCAIVSGVVKCWGSASTWMYSPTTISGTNGATQLAVGTGHACIIANGALKCWGANYYGQIGNGETLNGPLPVTTIIPSGVTQVGAGSMHTCAVVEQELRCWGGNGTGELGLGHNDNVATPQKVPLDISSGVLSLSVRAVSTCLITGKGDRYCTGQGYFRGSYELLNVFTPVP